MWTKAVVAIVTVLLALGSTSPASAKGMAGGTIEGDGIATPIDVFSTDVPGAANLVNETGVYETVWEASPSHALDAAPTDVLGPVFTIRWSLMGPNGDVPVVQDVYPYAEGGPVTHTAAGQPLWDGGHTVGGWFRSPERLVARFEALGVPTLASLSVADGGVGTHWAPIGASLVAVLLLGSGLAMASRRRREVAPAAG